VSADSIVLLHKQTVLTDAQTLGSIGVSDGELLEARTRHSNPVSAVRSTPTASTGNSNTTPNPSMGGRSSNQLGIPDAIINDPIRVREFIRSTPQLLFSIETQNPQLARAIHATDIAPFAAMWSQIKERMIADKAAADERFRLANADPMDPEVQARIAEEIRLKNVQENW
jgi:hypothetical protein